MDTKMSKIYPWVCNFAHILLGDCLIHCNCGLVRNLEYIMSEKNRKTQPRKIPKIIQSVTGYKVTPLIRSKGRVLKKEAILQ